MLPLQLGRAAFVFGTALVSLATAALVWGAARARGSAFALLAIPLTLFQPLFFRASCNALSEPLAALAIAAGVWAEARGRMRSFALAGGLLPLAG